MTKPVTPHEMFDLWQKMVNPSAYPLQSLMFPVLDPAELDKKVAELEAVEHWLRANLHMLQLSIKSLQFQRDMLKGGEKLQQSLQDEAQAASEIPNPAMWAWNMMAEAAKAAAPAAPPQPAPEPKPAAKPRKRARRAPG